MVMGTRNGLYTLSGIKPRPLASALELPVYANAGGLYHLRLSSQITKLRTHQVMQVSDMATPQQAHILMLIIRAIRTLNHRIMICLRDATSHGDLGALNKAHTDLEH